MLDRVSEEERQVGLHGEEHRLLIQASLDCARLDGSTDSPTFNVDSYIAEIVLRYEGFKRRTKRV